MDQYKNYFIKDKNSNIYKSLNDEKEYRFLKLDNNLKVLIIKDVREKSKNNQLKNDNKRIRLDDNIENGKTKDTSTGDKMSAVALCVNRGSFLDPIDLQGLSHFTEHCVLMGNKEFPVVNEFDQYCINRSGSTNAHTQDEYVLYEAQVPNEYLDGCLKRFAACFKGPLFKREYIESEIRPVNNEYCDAFTDDFVRSNELVHHLAKSDHCFSKFTYGNEKSLVIEPKLNNIDVRDRMAEFFDKYYKANRMSLVIQSQEDLDLVEKLAREYFKDIPTEINSDNEINTHSTVELNQEELIKKFIENKDQDIFSNPDYPFTKETMNKLYIIEPVEDNNTLQLSYFLPPMSKLFKFKPLSTLGSILGFEGENSLTNYLIKKKLINELSTGHDDVSNYYSNQYFSIFTIDIKLTDYGLENIQLVVQLINYYINLMCLEGPQENIFNEERFIQLTKIRFQDETQAVRNVQDLACQLFVYPVEYVVIGHKLLDEFNYDSIKYCLEFLKNQPRLTILQSKKLFKLKSNDHEIKTINYTNVEYIADDLPFEWNRLPVETEELKSKLKLPGKNEFISTDFNLKQQEIYLDYPILIDEDTNYKCYWKNDNYFKFPKSIVYLNFDSNCLREMPEMLVYLKFYLKYFAIYIGEFAYQAEMAGLGYEFDVRRGGLSIKINGYNEKLFKLLQLLLDHLKEFKFDIEFFDTIKSELIRDYYNAVIVNNGLVSNLVNKLRIKNFATYLDEREIVKKLNVSKITDFARKFFNLSYCQCLIQGNYSKEEAQEIFNYIKSTSLLGSKDLVKLENIKQVFIHQLPKGNQYCYVKSFNRLDETILVDNNYQLGKLSKEEIVLLELLELQISEPLFNTLRNEQTLGYELYSTHLRSVNDVCSIKFVVKSLADDYTPQYIDEKIEWFIDYFLDEHTLKLDQSKFLELKNGRIKYKEMPFLNLKKEANFNFKEICEFSYKFDKTKYEVQILKNLQMDQFISFSKNILSNRSENSKLSICSIGTGEKTEQSFDYLDSDGEKQLELLNDDEMETDEINIQLIYMKPNQQDDQSKLIDNIDNFINNLHCY